MYKMTSEYLMLEFSLQLPHLLLKYSSNNNLRWSEENFRKQKNAIVLKVDVIFWKTILELIITSITSIISKIQRDSLIFNVFDILRFFSVAKPARQAHNAL